MHKRIMMKPEKIWSRRSLLVGGVKLTAGAAGIVIGSTGIQTWSSRTSSAETLKWPWPYKKIEPLKAAKIGYEKYYEGACCYGVVNGIFVPLREEIGEPYISLPLEAFRFGHSGVVGWGTICGTLLGAGISTGFIVGKPGEEILNKLINWYTETPLPIFAPVSPRADIKHTSKSDSPLCHISAGRWMKKEGVKFDSTERAERCARLAADVAAKTVTFLNEWADSKFRIVRNSQIKIYNMPAQNNCTDCHGTNVPNIHQ